MTPIVLITKLDGGGMETFCLSLLRAWNEAGCRATLYTSYLGGDRESDIPPNIERVSWNLRAKKSVLKLAKWLRSRPEDPCLALSQELAVVLLVLKKLHLIGNRIYFRESTDVKHHYGRGFKRIMRWLWPGLNGIIEQSRAGLNETREICKGYLPESLIVRNIQSIPALDIPFEPKRDTNRLACVGSFKPMKGQKYLIEKLLGETSLDWQLIFWGNGEKRTEVEDIVRCNQYKDRVIFNDWASNIEKIYESCDIVVIPSDYEGLPNVMLEAILRGKRVSVRPTCVGACELLQELGIGVTWPWRKALEIPEGSWKAAREKLKEICNPASVAKEIFEFMSK